MRASGQFLKAITRRAAFTGLSVIASAVLPSLSSAATDYGIFDARTLAMGGASVASAVNDNAQFYNSALLAFNEEIEERTEDSRFLFPLLVSQASESAISLEELARDDAAGAISRAVSAFNATPDTLNAQAIVDASAGLDAALAGLDGEDLSADIFVGMSVSEPGRYQGAGFFFGARVLGGGQPVVTAEDRALLASYQEGLSFVASNGEEGVAHPELFDANGALIDPRGAFGSSVTAAGAIVTEAGVAMSDQVSLFGLPIAAGFSVKVQFIDTFEDVERIADDRIDVARNTEAHGVVNFDLGAAKQLGKNWRAGVAVKDVIPRNYDTSLGTPIRFRPRARVGVAYQSEMLQFAADLDVTKNQPLGAELPTQQAAVGAEWSVRPAIKLRAGIRHDIRGNRDPVISAGVGTRWKRLVVDAAYADGDDARAAALQFGVAF